MLSPFFALVWAILLFITYAFTLQYDFLSPPPDDIPIQSTEEGKLLTSISEEGEGDDKSTNKPIRTSQCSGRDKDNKEKDGKDKEGKEKIIKFVSPNIPIPKVKRKDREKTKNGDKKDSDKKSEKKEKHKSDKEKEKDKETRNGTSSNRNSVVINSDSDGGGNEVTIVINQQPQQQQQQEQSQQYEMKVILNKNPRHFDGSNTSAENLTQPGSDADEGKTNVEVLDHVTLPNRSSLDASVAQNHAAKVIWTYGNSCRNLHKNSVTLIFKLLTQNDYWCRYHKV